MLNQEFPGFSRGEQVNNVEWLVAVLALVFGDRGEDLARVIGLVVVMALSAAVILGVMAWADRPEVQR